MISKTRKAIIVYNGGIYNFREIKEDLKRRGYSFESNTDTEVILNLYLEYGIDMLPFLNGIFSFAIWDHEKNFIFIARDALGVKPLYYSEMSQGFIFGSEIKCLLPFIQQELEVDHFGLDNYLRFLWSPGSRTPIKNVRKLSPGEAIFVNNGKIIKKWNWYKLPGFSKSVSRKKSKAQWILETRENLKKSVERQMVSDVPVGAFLSGGLDSSSIVAFAKKYDPKIRCFTIDIDGGEESGATSDLKYATRVAEHLDVDLEVIKMNPKNVADDLVRMIFHLDEPLADPAPLNALYISELARKNGIKVLLSGAGGDDVLTGYRRHFALYLRSLLQLSPKALLEFFESITAKLDHRKPISRKLAKLFDGASLQGEEALMNFYLWGNNLQSQKLYTEDFKAEILSKDIFYPMRSFLKMANGPLQDLEKLLLLEQIFFLADHNLIYTDKMSMAAGVEVRVPFLDLEFMNFASTIPIKFKQRGWNGKWILKKAMEQYLPQEVIYRPKTGFGLPLRRWLKNELNDFLHDTLTRSAFERRNIFSFDAFQNLLNEDRLGKTDATYQIFSILCIELWFKKFLDKSY